MIRSRLVVTKQTPLASRGMVTAEHPIGAEVGARILERGGNAVDAAVATAFAMTVVEPFMSTIGGSGTMLVHLARKGHSVAVDFNGCAPGRAHETMFPLATGLSTGLFAWPRVEGEANEYGPRSAAVPGSVAGLTWALARYGTMELRDVLLPAIALARDGFVADWYVTLTTAKMIEELAAFPETARTYLRNGRALHRPPGLEPGDVISYPDLAQSLDLIARDGADGFYTGAIAEAIDAHMRATGGLISKEDLAAYRVREGAPLASRYRDLDLQWSPGATGGVTGLEILNVLDHFSPRQAGFDTVAGLHHRAEAVRRAFLDRFEYLGDPQVVKAPWDRLASREYARDIAGEIRRPRPRSSGAGPAPGSSPASGRRRRPVEECTTHVCAVDRQRNMVSLTHTAVSIYGSRVVVPGTGILLNNGMIWFDPQPGKPNSIAPGKRAMVNMVPALAFKRGTPYLAIGAPGGRKIISAIPQVIANVADGRGSLQAAVEAPRLHCEGGPLEVDDRVGPKAVTGLARHGHQVVPREETYASLYFAKPVAIRVTSRGLEAGLDHLRPAAAAGH